MVEESRYRVSLFVALRKSIPHASPLSFENYSSENSNPSDKDVENERKTGNNEESEADVVGDYPAFKTLPSHNLEKITDDERVDKSFGQKHAYNVRIFRTASTPPSGTTRVWGYIVCLMAVSTSEISQEIHHCQGNRSCSEPQVHVIEDFSRVLLERR